MAHQNVSAAGWLDDSESLLQIRKSLLNIALSRVRQPADAEEVVQQTMQALVEHPERVSPTPLQYAIGILRNKISDYYRRGPRVETTDLDESIESDYSLDDQLHGEELRRVIRASIARLKETCRQLFALLYLGMTMAEIQNRLSAPSVDSIKMRTSRCRAELKKLLVESGYRIT
jgi:RNA polymerase sigma factor (sigma-70 family)